VRQH